MPIAFTLFVVPRTKKTSNRLVSFGRPCYACRKKPFQKVLPSEAFEQMERECQQMAPIIRSKLESAGVPLPIAGAVSVRARFYRDAERGDCHGFYQALADVLQEIGIIADDKQIHDWDGTRLYKDPAKPRIEVELTVLQEGLF